MPNRARPATSRSPPLSPSCRSSSWASISWMAKRTGSLRCALIETPPPPSPLKVAAGRRPRLLAPADPAHLPLCLYHGGKELPVPAARATRCNGSPLPGTGRTSGKRWAFQSSVATISTADRAGARHALRRRRFSQTRNSSVGRRCPCSSSCRSRCPASSPASRCAPPFPSCRNALLVLDHRSRPRDLLRRGRL